MASGNIKGKGKVGLVLKDVAPSNELSKWFAHDPERCEEFQIKYYEELKDKKEFLNQIKNI